MKEYICCCINPDFESLGVNDVNEFSDFINNSNPLNKSRFIRECNLSEQEIKDINQFPNDFHFNS